MIDMSDGFAGGERGAWDSISPHNEETCDPFSVEIAIRGTR